MRIFSLTTTCLLAFWPAGSVAQTHSVAITIDDLPYADGGLNESSALKTAHAEMINTRLVAAFRTRHVPVTGFVIQKVAESLGPSGPKILKQWIGAGLDLGDHTYSHSDANDLTVEQIEDEIIRGETAVAPLMQAAGKRLAFFRFPFNHTGDTLAKHDAIAQFLSERGYRLATCTIDTSDYVFNQAYVRMLANHADLDARRLRADYIAYTGAEIDYYARLNKQVLGYQTPEVMLLHDNRLNADVIGQILSVFETKHYLFVSLASAQSGPAYRIPDTYTTKSGPMWGYRWARERNVKFDGRLEPDPPAWISEYGRTQPSAGPR